MRLHRSDTGDISFVDFTGTAPTLADVAHHRAEWSPGIIRAADAAQAMIAALANPYDD